MSRDRLTKYEMSGLLGTVIVAFAGMEEVGNIRGGHSHGEHEMVFDYEKFHHGDHELSQHYHHA